MRFLRPPGCVSRTFPAVRWVAASLGGQALRGSAARSRGGEGKPRGVRRVPRPPLTFVGLSSLPEIGPRRSAGGDPTARGPAPAPGGTRRQARDPLRIPKRQPDRGISHRFLNTKVGRHRRWGRGGRSHRARRGACAREGVRVCVCARVC